MQTNVVGSTHRGGSVEYPQPTFSWTNKKNVNIFCLTKIPFPVGYCGLCVDIWKKRPFPWFGSPFNNWNGFIESYNRCYLSPIKGESAQQINITVFLKENLLDWRQLCNILQKGEVDTWNAFML